MDGLHTIFIEHAWGVLAAIAPAAFIGWLALTVALDKRKEERKWQQRYQERLARKASRDGSC